jgi:hypothetical protein
MSATILGGVTNLLFPVPSQSPIEAREVTEPHSVEGIIQSAPLQVYHI